MMRWPIASPPVPALRVRSASSGVTALTSAPGPVSSDSVSGTSTSGWRGARRIVERYASYRYGGNTLASPRTISPMVVIIGRSSPLRCVGSGRPSRGWPSASANALFAAGTPA